MNKDVFDCLKLFGHLLEASTQENFWVKAITYLKYDKFLELLKVMKNAGVKFDYTEQELTIRHYIHQYIDSPFMIEAQFASNFVECPYACANTLEEVVNAALLDSTVKVYRCINHESGENDFLISAISIDEYIKQTYEHIYDTTGEHLVLDKSDFEEVTKPI